MFDDQGWCEWVNVSSSMVHLSSHGQRPVKRLCVCVCVCTLEQLTDDSLDDNREEYQHCSVLHCVI